MAVNECLYSHVMIITFENYLVNELNERGEVVLRAYPKSSL